MKDLIVRKAKPDEIDILLEFEQEIVKAERPFNETLKEGEIHYYDLRQLMTSPDAMIIVAAVGDEIIGSGYAVIKKAKDYLKHERFSYLGFMYAKPEHRSKGVNKQILEVLKKWSFAQGITELRLEVYSENSIAVRAYEKAGFKAHLLEMRMEISKNSFSE